MRVIHNELAPTEVIKIRMMPWSCACQILVMTSRGSDWGGKQEVWAYYKTQPPVLMGKYYARY